MTVDRHRAVARARAADGFAAIRSTPAVVRHIVDVTERPCHDGVLRYDWLCSCDNALGTGDTDVEARAAAKIHAADARFTTRPTFPFVIVRHTRSA